MQLTLRTYSKQSKKPALHNLGLELSIIPFILTLIRESRMATTAIMNIFPALDISTSWLVEVKKYLPIIKATKTVKISMAVSAAKSNQIFLFIILPDTYFTNEKNNSIATGITIESQMPVFSITLDTTLKV